MRRIIPLSLLFIIVSVSVFAAISQQYKTPFDFPRRYGVERVTQYDPRTNYARIDTTVYLEPTEHSKFKGVGRGGYAPFYARGAARVHSTTWYGYPRASVDLKVKDLPPSYENQQVYEGWLVDIDSGYRLSLGTFTTTFGGVGEMKYTTENYFDAYDYLEVTVEPYNDPDVRPGPAVLIGNVPTPYHFNPEPAQKKIRTRQIKTI